MNQVTTIKKTSIVMHNEVREKYLDFCSAFASE